MLYKLIVKPEAETDISNAIKWYEEQKKGLGIDYLLNFEEVAALLRRNPHIYIKIFLHFRRALMQKYPYAIYYSINEEKKLIDVYAVLHTARNPKLDKKRLKMK